MVHLNKDDLLSRREFDSSRDSLLEQLQRNLRKRRYILGPSLLVTFYDSEIIKFRLEQLLWAERVSDEETIEKYLNSFNQLIPGDNELIGEVILQFDDKTDIQTTLHQFQDLEINKSLYLLSDNQDTIYPEYHQNSASSESHCVYYPRFQLSEEQQSMLSNEKLFLAIENGSYKHRVNLDSDLL